MCVSPELGAPFWVPNNKEHSILWSIYGVPLFLANCQVDQKIWESRGVGIGILTKPGLLPCMWFVNRRILATPTPKMMVIGS